jgi:hypothetical protein
MFPFFGSMFFYDDGRPGKAMLSLAQRPKELQRSGLQQPF